MVNKQQVQQIEGVVTETLPNTMFRVELDGGLPDYLKEKPEQTDLIAYLAGRMRKYRIRVLIGDRVVVELDQYGGKGRIVRRR